MDNALRAEPFRILIGIRHIVAMSQEDVTQAALRCKAAHQMLYVTRRIDQPVPARMPQEVTVPAERLGRIEAAVRYALGERHRKCGDRIRDTLLFGRAD